jgi:hypothetical protein
MDVAPKKQGDTAYFARIAEQMANGGREALLHFLLNRDVSDWDHRKAPDTKPLLDQKLLTLPPVRKVIFEMLATGSHPLQFETGRGSSLSDTFYLGRCVQLSN